MANSLTQSVSAARSTSSDRLSVMPRFCILDSAGISLAGPARLL